MSDDKPTDITAALPTPIRRKRDMLGERRGKSMPGDVERWQRDYECMRMRMRGTDYDTIVEKLGYSSRGHAHDRFVAFMKNYPRDDVEAMRALELDRLDVKIRQLEEACERGDTNTPRAIEVWNKLAERRAKLMGLDKPERRELTVISEDTLDRSIREMKEEMDRKAKAAQDAGIDLPEYTS